MFRAAYHVAGPLVVIALFSSAIAAFFYLRIVVLMFFAEPPENGPTIAIPSPLTTIALTLGVGCHHLPRHLPAADPRPRQQGCAAADGVTGVSPAPLGVVFDDAELERSVRAGLDDGRDRRCGPPCDPMTSSLPMSARHLVDAGGKRFRPLLTLLAATSATRAPRRSSRPAVVVELTHLATLYHDDVMDEAPVRRGAASANARWDNTVAILTGDFLFSRASDLLADLGPEAVRLQARTFERLVTGQIRETVGPGGRRPDRRTTCRCSPTRPVR